MATDEELQRLAEAAWPGIDASLTAEGTIAHAEDNGPPFPVYRAIKIYGHPRAREPLEAALRVLAGEPDGTQKAPRSS